MASGDFTLTNVSDSTPRTRQKFVDLAVAGTYKAGGYAITPANSGFTVIYGIEVIQNPTGYVASWKASTGKLLLYCQSDSDNDQPLEEVPDTTNVGTPTVRLLITGAVV